MKRNTWMWGIVGAVAASMTGGCSSGADVVGDAAGNRAAVIRRWLDIPNGIDTNGKSPNGKSPNGKSPNGKSPNGKSANGTVVQGSASAGPTLAAVEIETGLVLSGSGLVGTELDGRMSDGTFRRVRVDGYDGTSVPGMELYLVNFVVGGFSICGDKDGTPIWATVMNSRFDPNTGAQIADDPSEFTFGCRFGGIQKCQEYGYPKDKKTKERKDGVDRVRRFNDYHGACVRMVRADYCGDGVPHTFDGTEIDIYDHLLNNNSMVTSTTGSDGFYKEAEWDEDGAHCINKTRWMPNTLTTLAQNQSTANPDWEYIRQNCPERFAFPVQKPDGNMSVPDRACGTSSNFNTSVAFEAFAADTPTQTGRNKIGDNSRLNRYVE